ncbi:amidohydrolase family protein [Rapidithrix thailandica]|uniref:Amidohydrolase family protein n=1 Tax=Rapidithrix thailandica TaxID=413964 RepID=A0AAW9S4Q4_9BACT
MINRFLFTKLMMALLWCNTLFAQNPKAETGVFALTNATLYTVTNGVIENGTLIIQDGKIFDMGTDSSIPAGAEVLNCQGLSVYPGLIDAGTQLGLKEIGSLQETRDESELGEITPQMNALTAINPNSVLIPVTRVAGVTTVLSTPSGGMFPGTAALINLHGYTPQQMFAGFKGVILNYPSSAKPWWDKRPEKEFDKEYKQKIKRLTETWEKAVFYHTLDSAYQAAPSSAEKPSYFPEIAALLPAVRGEEPLLVEVNKDSDILKALAWVKQHRIKAVFTGVKEGWRVADSLAAAKVPVITGPVLSTPSRGYDRYDKAYANAGLMKKAGVKVAIRTSEAENVRNLPYHAGFAAAYGLGKKEALEAVTIVPAEIFGLAQEMGSLEKGKQATLFITDGDPFETKTQVKQVFIKGWKVPLINRQTLLYDEFLERSDQVVSPTK